MSAKPAGDLTDLFTHREAWRSAIAIVIDTASPTDAAYWRHELEVFDRTFAELNAILARALIANQK